MKLKRIKETIGLEESGCNINLDNAIFITPELHELADRDEPMEVELDIRFEAYKVCDCPKCYRQIDELACNNFCGHCGQRLDWK